MADNSLAVTIYIIVLGGFAVVLFLSIASSHVSKGNRPSFVLESPRVFEAEIGAWPLVFQSVPGIYKFYAPYTRPDDWFFSKPSDPAMFITHETMNWASPSGQTCRVPIQDLKMHVQLPHRLADKEARDHAATMQFRANLKEGAQQAYAARARSHENAVRTKQLRGEMIEIMRPSAPTSLNLPPPRAKYQIASELIIRTGSGDHIWLPVAEFADDVHGERANMLLHAIDFVRNQCLREIMAVDDNQPVAGLNFETSEQAQQMPDSVALPVERFE